MLLSAAHGFNENDFAGKEGAKNRAFPLDNGNSRANISLNASKRQMDRQFSRLSENFTVFQAFMKKNK